MTATFPDAFTSPALDGETLMLDVDGFTVTATIHDDDDASPPWERGDGHGPVSDWTSRDKAPGERILNDDRRGSHRFYDFAAAVQLARRDEWGVSPYRVDREDGANGLHRLTGQWFHGRELVTHVTDWHDDANAAMRALYGAHRASMSPGTYAALAAESDFAFLKRWCDDEWRYVGVAVTVSREGVDLTGEYDHAIWGVESEAADHLTELANEYVIEALDAAREVVRRLRASVA